MFFRRHSFDVSGKGTGRRAPLTWDHVAKHPWSAVGPTTVDTVEKIYSLPAWHKTHDQGHEGSCVGHGWAMERGISNTRQNVLSHLPVPRVRRYNPLYIWETAKSIDEYADTNPGDDNGTSVHAGADVLLRFGAQRVKGMKLDASGTPYPVWPADLPYSVDAAEGISAVVWASVVDEIRAAIALQGPVVIGVNWYSNFDTPQPQGALRPEYWIGQNDLGTIRGGHCVCIYGASDKRQAFKIKNSWGANYPEVWLPFTTMTRLISEEGEVGIVTDK